MTEQQKDRNFLDGIQNPRPKQWLSPPSPPGFRACEGWFRNCVHLRLLVFAARVSGRENSQHRAQLPRVRRGGGAIARSDDRSRVQRNRAPCRRGKITRTFIRRYFFLKSPAKSTSRLSIRTDCDVFAFRSRDSTFLQFRQNSIPFRDCDSTEFSMAGWRTGLQELLHRVGINCWIKAG